MASSTLLRRLNGATPTFWRTGSTAVSSWPSMADSRCSGVTSGLLRDRASSTAALNASCVFRVQRFGSIAIGVLSSAVLLVSGGGRATTPDSGSPEPDRGGTDGGCVPLL